MVRALSSAKYGLDQALRARILILLVTGLGSLASALDSAAVFLIVPIVQRDFGSSIAAVQWVTLAFLLTISALLLPFGRLGDIWGLRRVYLAGIFVFSLSSVLCALAPTIAYLIGFRVAEAVGASMMIAAAPALLALSFPPERRGQVLGLQLTMTYLGLTLGPLVGGVIAGWWSWRGVFWADVGISLLVLFLALRVLPETPRHRAEGFDFPGAGYLAAAVLLVMLAVTRIGAGALPRAVLAISGLFFSFLFLVRERKLEARRQEPLLSLALFRDRPFSLSAATSLVGYICEFFVTFSMPFYLLEVLGLSPAQAGFLFMLKSLIMIVAAPVSGDLSDRRGPRALSLMSMACFAASFLSQSRLDEASGLVGPAIALALTGLAGGLFVSPNNSQMIGAAPPEMKGLASAMIGLVRNFGMVFGTAFSGALLALGSGSLLDGFRLATRVGALLALAGLAVAFMQAPRQAARC